MRRPFNGDYPVTQIFGVNQDDYKQFGLLGHNGIDFGLPSGTDVVSAISGTVIEVADDPTGYGLYIKIENDAEGFLVGHLQQQDVSVGQYVDEGQHIGLSDNSGNSSGPHLHFGYFRKPRDRQNGFSGYIDPSPFFTTRVIMEPVDNKLDFIYQGRLDITNPVKQDHFAQFMGYDNYQQYQEATNKALEDAHGTVISLQSQIKDLQDKLKQVPSVPVPSPEITPEPPVSNQTPPVLQFHSPLAKLLYSWAQALG